MVIYEMFEGLHPIEVVGVRLPEGTKGLPGIIWYGKQNGSKKPDTYGMLTVGGWQKDLNIASYSSPNGYPPCKKFQLDNGTLKRLSIENGSLVAIPRQFQEEKRTLITNLDEVPIEFKYVIDKLIPSVNSRLDLKRSEQS